MIRNVMSCDVCQIDQMKCNGWFAVWSTAGQGFHSCHVNELINQPGLEATPGRTETVNGVAVRHVCGSDHAVKLYQRWMATGSMEPEKPGGK